MKNPIERVTWVGEHRHPNGHDPVADMFLRGVKYHPDNIEPYDDWTPIAKELWFSRKFILKRLMEQKEYIENVQERYSKGKINLQRKLELVCSAIDVRKILELRLKEI